MRNPIGVQKFEAGDEASKVWDRSRLHADDDESVGINETRVTQTYTKRKV